MTEVQRSLSKPKTLSESAPAEPFLVLPENRLAHTAICEQSRGAGNLAAVFLYGPSGAGKSHLAWHAAQRLARERPSAKFKSIAAAEFAARLADAAQQATVHDFQTMRSACELFVLEDIHALEGRWESQRQLLALIDEQSSSGCRWIWTSRKSPGELSEMHPRLVNRFHGGVTALVRLPGKSSRVALLEHFARTQQVPLPAEGVQLLADALPVSPRELLAVVLRISQNAAFKRCQITTDLVRRFLQQEVVPPTVELAEIANAVARHFSISAAKLRSRVRLQGLVMPRQCAMYLSRELTPSRLEQIGQYYGQRDHSTVLHACRRLKQMLPDDATTRLHLCQIRAALGVHDPETGADEDRCNT